MGTIARQLGIHHGTVDRVLTQAGLPRLDRPRRPSLIDHFLPFILDTLKQFPQLTASRLYAMVRERGYSGGPDHFRHLIAHYRPRPVAEAYLRLRTLSGEQSQIDWGHFGKITIGRAERTLMAFVMVLSYSRLLDDNYLGRSDDNYLGRLSDGRRWVLSPLEECTCLVNTSLKNRRSFT